jgi:hypothetical protein
MQPRGEDLGNELVVLGELGAEECLAVVPEGVEACEESGFVGWGVSARKEEGEEASCDLALEEAKVLC